MADECPDVHAAAAGSTVSRGRRLGTARGRPYVSHQWRGT